MSYTEKMWTKCACASPFARGAWILGRLLSFVLAIGIGTTQTLNPSSPAKEYIRSNGRVVAVENATFGVNAGGGTAGSFVADTDYSGTGGTYSTSTSISTTGVQNPAPQSVYQTERYGNFTYTIPNLSAGASYIVRLHFAEIYWTQPGQRIFNVAINGTTVLSNFDIIAAAGAADQAIVEQFTVVANSSGQIAIQFTSVKDNAKLSGLEVL